MLVMVVIFAETGIAHQSQLPEGSENYLNVLKTIEGTNQAYRLAKQYNIKTAFGIDNLFDAERAANLGQRLVDLTNWYTPAEALKMATRSNAELLALSGLRNPYPGELGVVKEGALADLLLVNGNPLKNIDLVDRYFHATKPPICYLYATKPSYYIDLYTETNATHDCIQKSVT